MIEVKFACDTVAVLQDEMRALYNGAHDTADDPVPARTEPPAAVAPKRAGRPKKGYAETSKADDMAADSAAQPAVATNTGSDHADPSPSAGTAAAQGGGSSNEAADPAAAMSADEFKAKVQEFAADQNGYAKVVGVLQGFGYARIKEVQPKDYAAIIAKCGE